MTQPGREHRHDIHPRLCLSYGVVSHILWRQHLDAVQPVGTCTAPALIGHCGGLVYGEEPYEAAGRVMYPAQCRTCGHEVVGMGPAPAREAKR